MKYYLLTIPDNCKLECTYYHPEEANTAHMVELDKSTYKKFIKQLIIK